MGAGGPFTSYAPPGVYTRTLTDRTPQGLSGSIRMPVLVGVGEETLPRSDFELVRGSSNQADQLKSNEDVSSQLDGTNREFTTSLFPIVSGEGSGTTTNVPTAVTVTINGNRTAVAQVFGETGRVILETLARADDVVKISYFFKRTDTEILNEDASKQADGLTKIFKTANVPVVEGDNGGVITTNVERVTVTVNGTPAVVTALDGLTGQVTLSTAPTAGATVTMTYFTNTFQDTFDYLPDEGIVEVIRVGDSAGSPLYADTVDFVIEDGNKIQWGSSFSVKDGTTVFGTEPFDDTQISALLIDNKFFRRPATGTTDAANKAFILEQAPTDGSGRDRISDDPTLFKAFVGATSDPFLATEVDVASVNGKLAQITLKDAPAASTFVFVTFYYNLLSDDIFTITNTLASTGSSDGEYTVASENNGLVTSIELNTISSSVADPDFATESVTFPAGEGKLNSDGQTIPGFSIAETLTVTFTSAWEFDVTSSVTEGSSGNGFLNQTYADAKTGVRFTILEGTSVTYAPGDTIDFDISATHTTGPQGSFAFPGLKTFVSNSTDVAVGSTAILRTYNKSGLEPVIGDFYYVTYKYEKTDYSCKVFTDFREVEIEYGTLNATNRLTLGTYLTFLNGSTAIATCQVIKTPGDLDAPNSAYIDAIFDLETPLEGDIRPNILVPLTTELAVLQVAKKHVNKVSGQRFGLERTVVFGFAVGTSPVAAQSVAKGFRDERMLGLYPDGATVVITDELGNDVEQTVDGSFLAAAMSGLMTNVAFDVATPLTRKSMVGFNRLARRVDSVSMNQTATAGLTVLTETSAGIQIRQALTTDLTNVLTREPTVIMIKDFIQSETRAILDPFIGVKNLSPVLGDIEAAIRKLLNNLVQAEIITAFKGVSAQLSADDPTTVETFALYSPVFPLNYIVMTYSLRTSV